ncbi:MAG TPA: PhzF family phenazine biosynthesis isomerase [Chitinophagaceae bacterium]|nr:PhzF family phenazine biosynthesis isomerase [Chitinophagaceae bacterium]
MKTYFVDSFTTEKFKGNPAGVCFLDEAIADEMMQNIAREIGFSETAFVKRLESNEVCSIRYFSPKKEIPLCGHATLAAAKIIFDTTDLDSILFITGQQVELKIGKAAEQIVMEFPVYDTSDIDVPKEMLRALGIDEFVKASYSANNKIIMIEITNSDRLALLRPDFDALIRSYEGINGVLVTAPSRSTEYDFHYRYFWPWAGTNEDPVTGAVQTFLTKYWADKMVKNKLRAFQSSERTGSMTTELRNEKVLVYGDAVIMLEGDFFV